MGSAPVGHLGAPALLVGTSPDPVHGQATRVTPKSSSSQELCPSCTQKKVLQRTSEAPGAFHLPAGSQEHSAAPLYFQYLLTSHLFLGLFNPFCPSLCERGLY